MMVIIANQASYKTEFSTTYRFDDIHQHKSFPQRILTDSPKMFAKISFLLFGLIVAAECRRTRYRAHFHAQMHGATFQSLMDLPQTVFLVDPDDIKLTAEQNAILRSQGKTVLAYLSIGEAESSVATGSPTGPSVRRRSSSAPTPSCPSSTSQSSGSPNGKWPSWTTTLPTLRHSTTRAS